MFDECLRQISSEWMLEHYCEDELEYIAPVQIPLDQTERHGAHFQYIPLKALLRKIAHNEDVWAMLNQEKTPKHQDVMEDYTDGDQFKSCELSSLSNVRLHFYIDEFEIVNPLGSKRGKHKLTAVYFKLGNIDKKYTSKLENIYLSSLIRHRYIEEDLTNYNNLFQPLIEEVTSLETEGVTLSCNGESRRFYGTVVTISADNLSAHSLIGLKRNFSHGRICRFCMATKENITTKFKEEDFTLRDSANYRYHLQAVCENPDNGYPTSEQYNKESWHEILDIEEINKVRSRFGKVKNQMISQSIQQTSVTKKTEDLSGIQDKHQKRQRSEESESGEDEYSIGIHLEKMRTECLKRTPNIRLLQDCMARTRNERADYEPRTPNPVLYIKGRALVEESLLEILMEGEKVCEVDDLTMALAVLMAIHFIFNIEYAAKMRNTLKFVEKFLMCHNAETKIPPTVIKMANFLFD
ncbi:unnamed protein product [Leuciscus chuanchicus]